MTHRRPKSPGSFRDELGAVIERIAPPKHGQPSRRAKRQVRPVRDMAELNERLSGTPD